MRFDFRRCGMTDEKKNPTDPIDETDSTDPIDETELD